MLHFSSKAFSIQSFHSRKLIKSTYFPQTKISIFSSKRIMNTSAPKERFLQDIPRLGNQYLEDNILRSALKRYVPSNILSKIEPDLIRFGDRVLTDLAEWGNESEANPPKFVPLNAWGHRTKQPVVVCNGWKQMQVASAEEGLIAIAYERNFGEFSRLYQLIKMYLFTPSTAVFGCPLAMADGAARLIELYGSSDLKEKAYKRLTTRNPKDFWTSGQWMTERPGGSDVGNTETVARQGKDGNYYLSGYKFFTSASTSEMTILLARIEDENGNSIPGSKGLSCFYLETQKENGELNNLIVHRLKDKLGTKALPTAEIELINSPGKLIGKPQEGVKIISTILNLTRIHNGISSIAGMRRGIAIVRDYSHRREVFGKFLNENSLHLNTIADLEVRFRGSLYFVFDAILLLGKQECNVATPEEKILLRLLTPLVKLYTAKEAIAIASECCEALGGIGYLEDSGMPRFLRDAQVGAIWEGTTNVLSVDIWRPLTSENAYQVFVKTIQEKLKKTQSPKLQPALDAIKQGLNELTQFLEKIQSKKLDMDFVNSQSRNFAFGLSRVYIAATFVEHANWSGLDADITAALHYCLHPSIRLVPNLTSIATALKGEKALALDLDPQTHKPRGSGNYTPEGKLRSRI